MLIKAVELENAKSYDQARVEFTEGVNAIVGHNGAGKSTILETIGLVLFDASAYTRSEFVRNGARTATMTVEVESSFDGRPYHVVRRIGGTNQHYIFDPELDLRVCEGKADVLAFLRQHMGLDSRANLETLFKDAVGVAQGTFTAAFLLTAGQRKGIFGPLLQVDDYQKAVDKLLEPLRLVQSRGQELDLSIATMQTRLERLPAVEAEVAAQAEELERLSRQAAEVRGLLEAAVARADALDAVRQELAALQSKHVQAQQRQEGLQRQSAAVAQALADAEAAQAAVEKNQEGSRRYLAAQEEQKRLDARLRQRTRLEEERAKGDKAAALAESELARLQQDLSEIEQARATAEGLRSAVEEQERVERLLAEARQQAARLQDAQAAVARQAQQLERLATRRDSLQASAARSVELEARRTAVQAEIEELRRSIEELRQEDADLRAGAAKVKEQTATLEDVETAVCPVCEQPLTAEHRRELMARNTARLDELRNEYRAVQDGMKQAQDRLAAKQKELEQTEKELRALPRAAELEQAEQEIASGEAALAELRAQEAELAGAPAQAEALAAQSADLGDPRRHHAVAWERAQQAERVQAKMREIKTAIDERREALANIQARLAQYADVDAALDAVSVELQTYANAYQAVLSHQRVAATLENRRQEAAQLQEALAEGKAEIERLAAQAAEVEARFDAEAFRQARAEEQELRAQIGGIDARRQMLAQQQERGLREVAELKEVSASLDDVQEQRNRVSEQEAMLETVRAMLRQAGPYITRVLIRQISDNARQVFSDIMQDHTRHLAWNEDYGITLEVDGHERQFGQLSGGEQMIAALAVRLALLRELSSIDVAFFDEPTANLDETRRESLARRILEVKGFRQLFVISHDDTFEQATQNLIRVERVDGISRIVEN